MQAAVMDASCKTTKSLVVIEKDVICASSALRGSRYLLGIEV
jgi:hypothetical protein